MARPNHEFPYADGAPQLELLGAATSGNLALLEQMARQLDGGRGRLAEAVESVNDHSAGALHLTAAGNMAEICEFLVEDVRVNVDALDTGGRTPLVYAITCQGGHVYIVRILKKLCSPLTIAINSHLVKCVNLLLEAGADVNGIRGSTPLLAAATNGLTDVFKPLLDAGADPIVRDEYGLWPIQLAAYSGIRKGIEILFEVTSCIPAIHDWSVDGIISHVKSQPKLEDLPLSKMSRAKLKEEGHKALHKGDFNAAIEFYTMAMLVDPENIDSNLFGTRGFARLVLGNGEGALNDAHICRAIKPDADSCWLQGYSHLQLKEYQKACDAFLDGLKLKPCFVGIEKGLRQALSLLKESHTDLKNGLEGQYREARLFL